MTRRRSSPLGLELVLSVVLALVVLPLLSHGAPVQESHADLQRYSEGCYYNYNHYSEGDRILTNEPCLNCTCHNKMLMCYLRVCPFTKPIGHDCTVEKRLDQCCPIVTCPEVPVDIAHHSHQLSTSAPGTELSIPEKYGCSIDNKFYVEGAQVPSNPNKPCELCYCIRNRTACLMQECTLHIDGCQPIYNKGSCCPVRYNCDHENELLEIEDFSTTTTTVRPTQGYLLTSTTSPTVTTDCVHNNEVYADGASITGKNSCEHCYCMRGDIVCAVQECEMPTLESGAKTCRALPPAAGECCPSNYVCDDDSVTTEGGFTEDMLTTMVQNNLHESVSQEDVQLQEHIDDKIPVTEVPEESVEQSGGQKDEITPTTILPIAGEVSQPTEQEVKDSEVEEEKPLSTTVVTAIKETIFETTQSPIEHSTTHKTEEGFEPSHKDKEDESIHPPKEDEIINEEEEDEDAGQVPTTVSPVVGDIQNAENEEDEVLQTKIPDSYPVEETTVHSTSDEGFNKEEEDTVPLKEEDDKPEQVEGTSSPEEAAEKDDVSTASTVEKEPENISSTALTPVEESEDKISATEASESEGPVKSVASEEHIESEEILPGEAVEKDEASTVLPELESEDVSSSTLSPVVESEDVNKIPATEVSPLSETPVAVTSVPSKSHIEPEETSSESVEFSEESAAGQGESEDKIDEDISEPSSDSSTSSPIYEIITESDNIHIGMPEIGDHKTESDLPKKKPKDEPESVEEAVPIPSDVTKDEIPQVIIDGTTVHTVDTSTPTSSADGADTNEIATIKPETLDESTEGIIEGKPVQEDIEIPAVVEEVTEDSSKPVSGEIHDEEDTLPQTTAFPIDGANADEVSENQKKEEEPSTESSGTENRTTTSRPIRIHIAGEEESSEVTTKGTEKEFADSTTSVPSIGDSGATVTEREEEEDSKISTNDTSSTPSVIESEKPDAGEVQIDGEQDTTMKAPSVSDGALSSAEEGEAKPEKETEIPARELSTPTPPKASESATIIPLDLQPTSAEEEEIKGQPESDIEDLTTAHPLIDESEEHIEDDQNKIQPEDDTTSIPTIAISEPAIDEEEHKKKTEQSLMDLSTKHPSTAETEEGIIKGKPQYDSTETPAVAEYEATSVGGVSVQHDPELVVDSTITPESKPEAAEEDLENESNLDTSGSATTINPNVIDSEIQSAEEDDATTGSSLPEEEKTNEEEVSIDDGTTVRNEIEKQSEQASSDSTTAPTSIVDESESSEETHKTPASEENIKQQDVSDSTTVVPSVDVSDENVKEEMEDVSGDLTTVSPLDSEGLIDEEIKKQPEQVLVDSSTKTSVATPDKTSTISDQEVKAQQTTTSPTIADFEASIPKEEEKDKDFEISDDGSSTVIPTLVDSDTLSQTTDASPVPVSEEKQETPTPATAVPQTSESEQPSKESAQDKEPIDEYEVIQTTLGPIAHSDKESSESIDITEDSGIPMHDIIPSAIPGEGDCLANGKTFANNATVPTSNECELSCTCISSIIVCKKVECIEPPKPNNCVLDEASTDKCCPQYICGIDSFTDDRRPTTSEDIEDEEIQFTTSAPPHKYPQISTESPTTPEEDQPIREHESAHTELPTFYDENTTPVSIDFEQPVLTPEDPMSHVKTDEEQETSTKHSDEDIFVEGSTTTQPITVKPTKQVTGEIEQPIEVTSSLPESKEPEEITTVAAVDEREQKTTTPTYEEVPSTSGTVTKPEKAIIPAEEISTEGNIEKEITTLQPINLGASSEAPSVPSVTQTDDSTQSEEISETSDENSNESGEETDSDEDTKVPMLHKEEDQKITTSRPLVSEHVGDIEPVDESTRIPEIDYNKPEMPEDLSHTKVEDEALLEKEKPAKPIAAVELETTQESEESTDKIVTTPPSTILKPVEPSEDDIYNISVGISDKKDDIPSLESEEHKPFEEKPIASTIKPVRSEEEPDSEQITESKKGETETQTISSLPASGEESGLEKDQTPSQTSAPVYDEGKPIAGTIIPEKESESSEEDFAHSTSAPAIDEHSIEGSGDNISEADSEDKKHDVVSSTSIPTIDLTLAPVYGHESSEDEKDKIPSHTSSPIIDDHTPTEQNEYDIENEETPTRSPTIEEQSIEGSGAPNSIDKSDIEQNEIASQTSIPAIDKQPPTSDSEEENEIDITTSPGVEEHAVEGSGVPTLGDKSEQDEIISETSAPAIDKQPSTSDLEDGIKIDTPTSPTVEEHSIEGSGAPISEDKTDVEQDEIASQTTASTIEKQPTISDSEEENKIDVTSSPVVEEGSGTPISEDKTDVELNEIVIQTSSPAAEKQPPTSDNEEDNTIDITTPAVEEHTVEGSSVPALGDKYEQDEVISQTSAPAIDKQPSTADLGEEITIDTPISPTVEEHTVEGSGAPISEDKTDVEQDEIASQTTASTIEKQPSISDSEEENKIDVTSSPAVEEGSGATVLEDKIDNEQDEIASQTSTPAFDKQPSIPDMEDENKIDADSEEHSVESSSSDASEDEVAHKEPTGTQTKAPISDDEFIKVTVAPVSGDEDHSVTPITSTIAPVSETESEEVISNQTNAPSVHVPSSEEESDEEKTSIEGQTSVPSYEVNDKITTEIPSYQTTEKESTDSTSSYEEGEDIVSGTVTPVGGDKYEETELPEDKKPEVLVPISGDEKELEFTTVSTDVKDESLDISEAPTKDMETSDENIDSGISIPAKTSDESIDATDAPSKDTSPIVSGDEFIGSTEISAISTPVKNIDEEKENMDGDKTSSTIIPIKTLNIEGEISDSTELPSSSTPAKPIESIDEDLEATEHPQVDFDKTHTSDEASSTEIESLSPVTMSISKVDAEVFSQTQAPVSSDSNATEEIPISQTEEQSSDEKEHIDKTLLTTESSLPVSETVSPSFGTEIDDSESEDKIDQIPSDKPSTQTKQPELMGEETSTKSKDESESTNATIMPDIISSHEIIPQPGNPESDDQILTDDIATDKPSAGLVPAESESSTDGKKPSLQESQTAAIDKSETNEQPETPESIDEESAEDKKDKIPQTADGQTETPASSEQAVSSEDAKPEDVDKITTKKPIDSAASMESQEEDVDSKPITSKPAEETAATESEEQDDVKVSSTIPPVDQQHITSSAVDVHVDSEHISSTEESDEEKEHTEAPIDNTKIQTIGEFVTERAEDMTNEDKETISEQPISPELPETATSLTEGQEEEAKPEVSMDTTESVPLPELLPEEIEEKTQVPEISTEISAEDTKPQVQPASSTEESEEKTQRPEITSGITQVQETGSVEESEEKTQAPEIQPEIVEEDHKQHVQPTEGATASSTSDKPIVPTADDKIDSDLPKPIATDDQPSAEDETPLSTTIHPLFPHIEHDRTTSTPQLNATEKVDHKIPESSSPSIPTTEQPTSQAITNAPTTQYQPPGYGQVPPQYPSYTEDEYTDEDETEVFGPGTCRYGGKLFVSAQQIPRDDPCDFCFCFRSDIICLQQSCPPPISGCHEEPISGFCCPRYECPVSMATTLNITTSTTTTSTTLPPHFLHHAYRGAAAKNGCHISGKSYKVGDKIDSASGPCMHCTCGGDGQMKCDPKTCSPEPMLRQMIAVVASRRR